MSEYLRVRQPAVAAAAAASVAAVAVAAVLLGTMKWCTTPTMQRPTLHSLPSGSHFAQVVWIPSTQLACAAQVCPGGLIAPGLYNASIVKTIVVCRYDRSGLWRPAAQRQSMHSMRSMSNNRTTTLLPFVPPVSHVMFSTPGTYRCY